MKVFRCSDVYLAAYLRSLGYALISHEMSPGNQRFYYSFEDSSQLRDKVQGYRYGHAHVHPRVLRDNVRDIKTMVASGKRVQSPI